MAKRGWKEGEPLKLGMYFMGRQEVVSKAGFSYDCRSVEEANFLTYAQKAQIVLVGLRGETSIAELCRRRGSHRALTGYYPACTATLQQDSPFDARVEEAILACRPPTNALPLTRPSRQEQPLQSEDGRGCWLVYSPCRGKEKRYLEATRRA